VQHDHPSARTRPLRLDRRGGRRREAGRRNLDIGPDEYDEYGHIRLGGIGNLVASEIEARTGFETRLTVLGHVQRGGSPTAYDRVLSTWFGVEAIDAVHDHAWGQMVALQSNRVVRVQLADAVRELKYVNPQLWAVAKQFFA